MWLDRDTRRKSISTVGVHVSYDMLTVCVMLINVLCTSECVSSTALHGAGWGGSISFQTLGLGMGKAQQ